MHLRHTYSHQSDNADHGLFEACSHASSARLHARGSREGPHVCQGDIRRIEGLSHYVSPTVSLEGSARDSYMSARATPSSVGASASPSSQTRGSPSSLRCRGDGGDLLATLEFGKRPTHSITKTSTTTTTATTTSSGPSGAASTRKKSNLSALNVALTGASTRRATDDLHAIQGSWQEHGGVPTNEPASLCATEPPVHAARAAAVVPAACAGASPQTSLPREPPPPYASMAVLQSAEPRTREDNGESSAEPTEPLRVHKGAGVLADAFTSTPASPGGSGYPGAAATAATSPPSLPVSSSAWGPTQRHCKGTTMGRSAPSDHEAGAGSSVVRHSPVRLQQLAYMDPESTSHGVNGNETCAHHHLQVQRHPQLSYSSVRSSSPAPGNMWSVRSSREDASAPSTLRGASSTASSCSVAHSRPRSHHNCNGNNLHHHPHHHGDVIAASKKQLLLTLRETPIAGSASTTPTISAPRALFPTLHSHPPGVPSYYSMYHALNDNADASSAQPVDPAVGKGNTSNATIDTIGGAVDRATPGLGIGAVTVGVDEAVTETLRVFLAEQTLVTREEIEGGAGLTAHLQKASSTHSHGSGCKGITGTAQYSRQPSLLRTLSPLQDTLAPLGGGMITGCTAADAAGVADVGLDTTGCDEKPRAAWTALLVQTPLTPVEEHALPAARAEACQQHPQRASFADTGAKASDQAAEAERRPSAAVTVGGFPLASAMHSRRRASFSSPTMRMTVAGGSSAHGTRHQCAHNDAGGGGQDQEHASWHEPSRALLPPSAEIATTTAVGAAPSTGGGESGSSGTRSRDAHRSTRTGLRRAASTSTVTGLDEVLTECQFLSVADVVAAVAGTSEDDLQRARAHVVAQQQLHRCGNASFAALSTPPVSALEVPSVATAGVASIGGGNCGACGVCSTVATACPPGSGRLTFSLDAAGPRVAPSAIGPTTPASSSTVGGGEALTVSDAFALAAAMAEVAMQGERCASASQSGVYLEVQPPQPQHQPSSLRGHPLLPPRLSLPSRAPWTPTAGGLAARWPSELTNSTTNEVAIAASSTTAESSGTSGSGHRRLMRRTDSEGSLSSGPLMPPHPLPQARTLSTASISSPAIATTTGSPTSNGAAAAALSARPAEPALAPLQPLFPPPTACYDPLEHKVRGPSGVFGDDDELLLPSATAVAANDGQALMNNLAVTSHIVSSIGNAPVNGGNRGGGVAAHSSQAFWHCMPCGTPRRACGGGGGSSSSSSTESHVSPHLTVAGAAAGGTGKGGLSGRRRVKPVFAPEARKKGSVEVAEEHVTLEPAAGCLVLTVTRQAVAFAPMEADGRALAFPVPGAAAPLPASPRGPLVTHVMRCTDFSSELSAVTDLLKWAAATDRLARYLQPSTDTEVTT